MQIKRLFTTKIGNPCDSKFFDSWSREACEAFAPAFHSAAPESFSIVEENTLPSWLWRHRASSATRVAETNPRQVIERIAGAATYAGWKKGLWSDETNASAFHDEVCALLARRLVALDPYQIGAVGLDWAYGFEAAPSKAKAAKVEGSDSLALPNATIDAILSGSDTEARARWQKYLADTKRNRLTLQFTDTENEWRSHVAPTSAPRLAVNLLAFRSEDGRIDVAALRHAVRLSVILMELHYEQLAPAGDERRALSLGIDNLAAALAAMALPYDSVAGRATAAALSAIVSAESAIASAHLAQALGPCGSFAEQREGILRALRNRRRAAYGERNDYERLSILPAQLEVGTGVDLILLATARRCWDDALVQVMCHGLRHAERTALFATPDFSALLDCSAQGCEAESQWIRYVSSDSETFQRALHPAAALGLAKLGCDPADIKGLTDYAVGSQTLVGAPVINHDSLRQRGFDEAALERLENYLPRVNHIRAAFTPWVLGKAFCQNVLHLSEKSLSDPLFDILGHLGFDQQDIAAANAFCCGHGSFTGSLDLPLAAKNLFATREALSPDAQMRMAAAVQSFVEGDVGLVLSLPASTTVPERADILLTAWQQGLRSVTLYIEGVFPALQSGAKAEVSVAAPAPASPTRKKMLKRKTAPVATPVPASMMLRKKTTAQMTSPRAPSPSLRSSKPKATSSAISAKRAGKPSSNASEKRR